MDNESIYSEEESIDESEPEETEVLKEEEIVKKKQKEINNYFCYACKNDFILHEKEIIKCTNCGCRIIYKKRTTNYINYKTD